jgi:hypothetical protein
LKKSEIEVMEPIREFLELTEDNFMWVKFKFLEAVFKL